MTTKAQAYAEGFVKRASEYGFDALEAVQILQKTAKLSVKDLESYMGHLFHDNDVYADASKGVDEANEGSFALRHPFLTGLPTLGLWPSIAKSNAMEDVGSNLLRKHKSLRDERDAMEEAKHRRKMDLMPLEMEKIKRKAQREMLESGGLLAGGLLATHHHYNNNRDRRNAMDDHMRQAQDAATSHNSMFQ
jgi:hypothetical protein